MILRICASNFFLAMFLFFVAVLLFLQTNTTISLLNNLSKSKRIGNFSILASKQQSPMQSLICNSPAQFEDSLKAAENLSTSTGKPLFIVFTGEKLETTGKSWCPDCVVAEPILKAALEKVSAVHLECSVKREEYKVELKLSGKIQPFLHRFFYRGTLNTSTANCLP